MSTVLEQIAAPPPVALPHAERRTIVQGLRDRLIESPELAARYDRAKGVVRAFRRPAFYEVSTRCNLKCEGCYYFSDDQRAVKEERDPAVWEEFFRAEGERGVTMAYFVGAEPALEQERLIAASRHFPHGNVGTNGIVKLDPSIPFRIGVSVWGVDAEIDAELRGASAFRKAIRNYAGDPRAIILYTLTRSNLGDVRQLAEICRDHDLPLTFNMYSPTQTYTRKLREGAANDRDYFRISSSESNLRWDAASLREVRRLIPRLMDDFPETIVYSASYNEWATREGPLYDIDPETGVARDCHSRMVGTMRYYKGNLRSEIEKCGTSDAICSECRMYSGGWSSKFEPRANDVRDRAAFSAWLGMIDTLGKIFLLEGARPAF